MLDGDDPIEMKRKKRDEAKAQTAERMIFRDAVAKFLEVPCGSRLMERASEFGIILPCPLPSCPPLWLSYGSAIAFRLALLSSLS